jgi:enamine deaminase RidA (YjgF/YER057c/UK114 family)
MSPRRLISSGSPFEAAYGYSRAVCEGEFVFISGTTGYDYATMTIPDDVGAQARNVYKTFAKVLAEASGGLEDVVSLRTFVARADYREPVLRAQGEAFAAIRPAAAIYVIAGLLEREMKVEIEAAARLGPREGAARAG